MNLPTIAVLLALASTPEIPIEQRYGGVIATLGPVPQAEIDASMDKVCGKGKWKLWKITTPDPGSLPPSLRGAGAKEHRFWCLPVRKFIPTPSR